MHVKDSISRWGTCMKDLKERLYATWAKKSPKWTLEYKDQAQQ